MAKEGQKQDCFVIMPITDPDGYTEGHFRHVYENIIKPACKQIELNPIRADDVNEANLIHLDILKKLLDSPIAICDLSTRNPNVLFELGVRQAFDKPVVLIQEEGTSKIFDIAPLRYLEYSKDMKYHDVLKTQNELKETIEATLAASEDSVNSIIKLLAISEPATIPNIQSERKDDLTRELLKSDLSDMRRMMEVVVMESGGRRKGSIAAVEYERIANRLDQITLSSHRVSERKKYHDLRRLMGECEELIMTVQEPSEHSYFMNLMNRIRKNLSEMGETEL